MPDSDNTEQTQSPEKNMVEIPNSAMGGILRFRRPLIVLVHILAFATSLMLSFLLITNMQLRRQWLFYQYPILLMCMLPIKLLIFGLFKQYRGWWRYVGISDLIQIVRASLVSTLIIVALWYTMLQVDTVRRSLPQSLATLTGMSQGVLMLDLFTTIMILSGLRMLIRMYHEEFLAETIGGLKRFLIVGAGDAGEGLLREIMRM